MESGLEDRNNFVVGGYRPPDGKSLNGVRPRRPEQCEEPADEGYRELLVSMESGLEDRNNRRLTAVKPRVDTPSQWSPA